MQFCERYITDVFINLFDSNFLKSMESLGFIIFKKFHNRKVSPFCITVGSRF